MTMNNNLALMEQMRDAGIDPFAYAEFCGQYVLYSVDMLSLKMMLGDEPEVEPSEKLLADWANKCLDYDLLEADVLSDALYYVINEYQNEYEED